MACPGRTAVRDREEPALVLLFLQHDFGFHLLACALQLHAHQYYQAHVGGLACFGFVEFPISPIQYRPGAEPPPFEPRFEWTPERYDHAVYGDSFDYWLVRHARRLGSSRSIFRASAPSGAEEPHVVFEGPRWTLYARPGLGE